MKNLNISGVPPVFQEQCFSATPEDANILHLNIKVQVSSDLAKEVRFQFQHLFQQAHQLCVLVLIFLVRVERSKLDNAKKLVHTQN